MTAAPASSDDLLWQASIDDKTQEFFETFDANVDKVNQAAKKGFDDIKQAVDKSGVSIGVISGLVGMVTEKLLDMGVAAIQSFVSFLKESNELRARVDTLGVSLNIVGQNAGYTAEEISKLESQVKKKGITTRQARDSLIQMAQAELDLTKASDLARVSQDAAVNAGITSAEAFDRITRAIVTLQPEILRNLNLDVKLDAAYAKYAATVGKTSEQLSFTEKKQVAMNAVLQQGTVIAGTYEASMNSVGKLINSLPRYIEELQYELGGLFQPAYFEAVKLYKKLLEDVLTFVKENRGEIDKFADSFGDLIQIMGPATRDVLDVLVSLTTIIIKTAGVLTEVLAPAFGLTAKESGDMFIDLKEGIATLAGLSAVLKVVANDIAVFKKLFSKDPNQRLEFLEGADDRRMNVALAYQEAHAAALENITSALEDTKQATDEAAESSSKYAEILAQKLADAITLTEAKLKDLQEKLEDEAMERSIRAQREIIEEELRAQWAREDSERNHLERIQDILENAEEAKAQAIEQAAENRLQIEEDYRKRLQQIQEDFEFNASELARKRDANGLLALIRQNKRQLDKEKTAYEERMAAAEENFKKVTENIDKSLQEQLEKAEEARAKELENYARNLERQKILKDLHNQWEEEDRLRAQQKALEDIVEYFMSLDGATQAGLNQLLQDWNVYFSQLDEAIAAYGAIMGGVVPGGGGDGGEAVRQQERNYNRDLNGDGVIGQAGQVSQMLGGAFRPSTADPSRLPAVPGTSMNKNVKEIKVTADGNMLEPYMQRVLVNALMEIERNNG